MLIDELSINRTVLSNGLTVLIQTDRSAPAVAIVTYVKAGYFDETDDEVGISHVLEHMYFKGTSSRAVGEISRDTKAAGGYLNAHTIYDNTTYYTVLPSSALQKGLEIQADAFAGSSIDAGELAKEIQVIIEEAKRKEDNAPAVATETLFELLHDRHRIRRWRIGREAQLRTYTRDRVLGFYRNFYRPRNTILAISGDVEATRAIDLVSRLYGGLQDGKVARTPGPHEPERREFRYRELSGDVSQCQFLLGWRTPGALHPDTPALDLAAALLGSGRASRLYRAVRERRLAASISCSNHTPVDLGIFAIHGEAAHDTTLDAMRASWAEASAIALNAVAGSELQRVRNVFESHWARMLETAEGRANHIAEWEALGGWRLAEEYRAAYLSTDVERIAQVARQHLGPDQAGVLVYRPGGTAPFAEGPREMRALLASSEGRIAVKSATPPAELRGVSAVRVELEKEEAGVFVFRTVTGIPILIRPKPSSALTYVSAHALGGSVDEPADVAGLTLLAMRTALKGTLTRSAEEIAEGIESLGATLSSSAGKDSFGWALSVPTANLGNALELLGDVIARPSFRSAALETERSVALSNLALLRDDMFRYPVRLATGGAFFGHPYGVPVSGSEDSLRAVSSDALRGWHSANVLRSDLAVGVVGDVEPAEAAGMVASALKEISFLSKGRIGPPAWGTGPRTIAESRVKAQTAMALAFQGPGRTDETRFAARILATIASGLGGRFFEELRDRRSLAYTVSLSVRCMALSGMFVSYIATSPENESMARDALLAEFERFRAGNASDDEMARSKEYLIGSRAISQEGGAAVLGELLDAWLLGGGLFELLEHDAKLRAVSIDGVRSIARRFFHPEMVVEGVVRGSISGRSP